MPVESYFFVTVPGMAAEEEIGVAGFEVVAGVGGGPAYELRRKVEDGKCRVASTVSGRLPRSTR